MKTKVKLTNDFLSKLPPELTEGLEQELKTSEVEEPTLKRQVHAEEIRADDERTIIAYASTRDLDRDYEVVMPEGVNLDQYRKAPHLLWNHKWSEPPIGHDGYIGSDGKGLVARSHFAKTALAEDIWQLVQGKHLRTSSIGFVTLEYIDAFHPKFGSMVDLMRQRWPEFDGEKADNLRGIHARTILMEHSIVSVPANPEALVINISNKSLQFASNIADDLGLDFEVEEPGSEAPVEDEVSDDVVEPPEPASTEEKPAPKVKLIARLVHRPEAVRKLTDQEIAKMVQEQLELKRGRI